MGRACGRHGQKISVWWENLKRQLGRHTGRWEDNITIDFQERGYGCGPDLSGSGYGKMAGSCGRGTKFRVL
jgi:hypothetical protein